MGLIDRLRAFATPVPVERGDFWPYTSFNGHVYPITLQQTLQGIEEKIGGDFAGLASGALKANPVVYACMLARASLFSEARFMYRQLRSGTPGDLFSLPALELLRHPWPGGTTGDLLARAMQDADLAGNAFFVRRPGRIVRLRPDWVTIIHGSTTDGADMWDPDAELLGYGYQPGGPMTGARPIIYLPEEVAHFAPMPDPTAPARGMSWLTPLIREVQADSQATSHKLAYFANGATPNLVVTGVPGQSTTAFLEWVNAFESRHKGAVNAYKSLYLSSTMDAKVVGSDMAQVDFKATQGAGETRIAAAAGVPAAVVGISEGLAGSSLNAGNFAASMRRFADLTMRPLWRNICGSFERIVPVPGDAELWYDDRSVPALKDDVKDAAEVQALQAQAIRQYVDAGFEPDSVVAAVKSGDLSRLSHTGLYSVQLQPPMPEQPDAAETEPEPEEPAGEPDQSPEEETPTAPSREGEIIDLLTRIAEREQPAPVVNVTLPEPAPVVLPEPVERAEPMATTIEYDAEGRVSRIVEVPA